MAAKAALAVLLLLAPTLATANFRGWTYKKPYTNVCKRYPCTSNPAGYKPPQPYPAKPDPKQPSRLICEPGYIYVASLTGYTTPQCVPCESGFYSPGGRSTRCLSCGSGAGFITPQGAASASQCVCIAGFGGPGCKQCTPGTFSTGGRPGLDPQPPCQVCPEGAKGSTKAGAISSLECGGCLPGYGGSSCTLCRAGTWSAGGSYAGCTRCGRFQTSRPGSPGADYCVCAAGYGSTDGTACTICPIGSFWPGAPADVLSPDALVAAAAAKKKTATLTACLPCKDANEAGEFVTLTRGAKSEAACVCRPGYGGSLCSLCPQGTWSAGGSTAPCTACGGLGTTEAEGATSVTQCGCQAGYGGSKCERCPADTYSTGGTQSECQPCPVNTQAPVGSQSAAACVPKPGFGIVGSAVVPCPINTWSAGGVNGPCTDCPAGTVSPSGSTSSADCVCQPGYKTAQEGCVQCARGEVCPGGAAGGAPKSCPPGATSDVGSDSPADCVCLPGYGGANCDLCPEGYFGAGGSLAGCQKCGLGQTSPAGSSSSAACVCLPGRGGASCALCPTGTYSSGGSTAACDTCPTGTTTTSTGNDDPSDCVCQPGFAGPFCTACKAGEMCPGGTRLAPVVCPANAEAPAGATTVQQCVCKAGFGRPSGAPLSCTTCPICEACPVGTWSAGNTTDSCKPCGRTETTATVGSESAAQCVCQPGYGGADCAICPAGTYSTGFTEAPCTPCPGNSTSAPGAKSSTECVCSPGFGGPTCAACPAGTFSPGGSKTDPNAACVASLCPGGQQATRTGCACKPGFGGGSATAACTQCPPGTYGPGGSYDACLACGFGLTSGVGSDSAEDCVQSSVKCPAGMLAPPGTVSVDGCVCLDGFGFDATTKTCKICPAGTYALVDEEPGLSQCLPCPFGTTSAAGKTGAVSCVALSSACPVGMYLPNNTAAAEASCVCKPGYGGNLAATSCFECPAGTYSDGSSREPCKSCPFGTTSGIGAVGSAACVQTTVACPAGQIAPIGAVSKDQCGCAPGTGVVFAGQTATPTCQVCPVGTYSPGGAVGGVLQPCQPCSFGFTSPAGSFDVSACYTADQCPPGTFLPSGSGSSVAECVCKPGYGGSATGAYCAQCPIGTFSGEGLEGCKLCPFGTTSPAGSDSIADCTPVARSCPIGMAALPGAASSADCACLPGYGFATSNPSDGCRLCPVGTYSDIIAVDGEPSSNSGTCKTCGFGFTSRVGSDDVSDCFPVPAGTLCPPGMEIPAGVDGASTADCQCKAGYGAPSPCSNCTACALCPSGFYSAGGTRDVCEPCPFGSTSAQGSDSVADCVALPAGAECPPGQMASYSPDQLIVDPDTPVVGPAQCHCYPGFGWVGNTTGGQCQVCPVGTFSAGVINAPCFPCGFGMTSPIGSIDATDCYPVNQCPMGMTGPTGNVPGNPPSSVDECVCLPGYGANNEGTACFQCPAGTYSTGGSREPCVSCGFGFTSRVGEFDIAGCQEVTQKCPVGQFAPVDAVSAAQCGCLPGYGGGPTTTDACTLCPIGTYSRGGDTAPCRLCYPGFTSPLGSTDIAECFYNANFCPSGMVLPSTINGTNSSTPSACVCQPGFGFNAGVCTQCAAGTYATPNSINPCSACPTGSTSLPGAIGITGCGISCPQGTYDSGAECTACPAGTSTPALPTVPPTSADDCTVCAAGFGITGTSTGAGQCRACGAGFYSAGGQLAPCLQCAPGTTSLAGASSCYCEAGFGSTDNTTCTACPIGSYSDPRRGLFPCISCGVGFTTIANVPQTSNASCGCAAGYGSSGNGTQICAACISPTFQGQFDVPAGSGITTTATANNPFPVCQTCAGQNANPPTSLTGDINGRCTFGTNRPSATCLATNAVGVCTSFTATCVYNTTNGGVVRNYTLPSAIVSAAAVIEGAQGTAGQGYTFPAGGGAVTPTAQLAGGLGGRLTIPNLLAIPGVTSNSTIWIVQGRRGAQPQTAVAPINQAWGGGGGGYSAILSGSDPLAATWYGSAGGGGGGGSTGPAGPGSAGGNGCAGAVFIAANTVTNTAAGVGAGGLGGGTPNPPGNNGFAGTGPAVIGNTGAGGAGLTGTVPLTNGAAGGGGGGGWGLTAGAGGSGYSPNPALTLYNGLAGGLPGGGGGGGQGNAAETGTAGLGGSASGGGGGGFSPAAPAAGASAGGATIGQGGVGGACQAHTALTGGNAPTVTAGARTGDGVVTLTLAANNAFTC